jgi:hypothetical protein
MLTKNREQDRVLVFAPLPGLKVSVTHNRTEIAAGLAAMVATWVCWAVDALLQRGEAVVELGRSCRAQSNRWVTRQGVMVAQRGK